MTFNRRPGGRDDRPRRFDRGDRPDRYDRGNRGDRGDRGDRPDRDQRGREPWRPTGGPRPPAPRRAPDRFEDAGMSIRLDPRRLGTLKQLAGEAGLRPGELVLQWVEERIDAARRGEASPVARPASPADAALVARLEDLAARVAALEAAGPAPSARAEDTLVGASEAEATPAPEATAAQAETAATEADAQPRRRGRPRKTPAPVQVATGPRVALHDEITAVIQERGASTANEIAQAIAERGRYSPPRSGKGLDAATVNSRVSNPAYRDRFRRQGGRIGLAEQG